MQEESKTVLPNANTYRPHQEGGVEHLTFAEECRRAAESAAKQSTRKDSQ
jgi:hypothetical protein